MTRVRAHRLGKSYDTSDGSLKVLADITFEIRESEFVTFFGPNGAGKTTLMNIVAGLDRADEGALEVSTSRVIPFVFQDFRRSLLPWMNARQNILFPLTLKRAGRPDANARVDSLLRRVPVTFSLDAPVYTLSGGQAQLVSLLRALVIEPEIVLLDEPFSALDFQTTLALRQALAEIASENRLTMLFVSHDIEEALYLGDRVIFLSKRPACVVGELPVHFPRPRHPSLITTAAFGTLKRQALGMFERAIGTPILGDVDDIGQES